MKTGRTLMELAQEIERQKETKLDLLDATPSIEMRLTGATPPPDDGPGEVSLVVGTNGDRRSFGIRPHAHQQIAAGLEIPRAYYERMLAQQPDLLAVNVNRWLHAEPVTRMVRTLDGDVRAWLSNRYRPLDNESVIEFLGRIFDKHGAGLEVKTCEITERRLYLKVSYPLVQGEVAKGDIVQSGFVVTNSEVGAGALSVYPWVLPLVCLNGMKVESAGQRRNHIGRRQEIEAGGAVIEYRDDTQAASDKAIVIEPPTRRQGARRVWSDSKGDVWVAEWNSGQLSRFEPKSGTWAQWKAPGESPRVYAVYVDERDKVWVAEWSAQAMLRFDPATQKFESFKSSTATANVRQIHGRRGEVWTPESAADKLVVYRYK